MKHNTSNQKRKPLMRSENTRDLRQILIVCEGKKTEPNYFKNFPQNPDVYDKLNIHGPGYNTLSLVNEAIRLKNEAQKKGKPYIEAWCVFDKDDFPITQFQNAIILAEKNRIKCAYSVEAFELWYMLHFNFYESALSREQYKEKLTKLLNKPYEKNDEEIYRILEELQHTAIKNAQKLYFRQHKRPLVEQNPITTVFQLVERLLPP